MEYAQEFQHLTSSIEFQAFKKYWCDAFPASSNTLKSRHLVVGAGAIGLTTAIRHALDGHKVKVIAKELIPKDTSAPGYVSTVAGAVWEYPPAVCGRHKNEKSIAKSTTWAMVTYHFLHGLSKVPGDHGVKMVNTMFYFRYKVEERESELKKMNDIAENCVGFERGLHLVDRDVVSEEVANELRDCYKVLVPVVDTNRYLLWLHLLALDLGVSIYEGEVPAPIKQYEQQIKKQHNVDVIINCSGLGSLKLVPDKEVYPLRGALCRVWNDGRDFPVVNKVHAVGHDERNVDENGHAKQDIIFIVPRGKVLLLGGIAEEDEWDLDVNLKNYQPYREMLERCIKFMPQLKRATLIEEEPLRAGLRPGHSTGVKNFVQPGTSIVHSYGHGGSGFSFSIGSANEALMRANALTRTGKTVFLMSNL